MDRFTPYTSRRALPHLLQWGTVAILLLVNSCHAQESAAGTLVPEFDSCNKAFSVWDPAQQRCSCPRGRVDVGDACCEPGKTWSYETLSCVDTPQKSSLPGWAPIAKSVTPVANSVAPPLPQASTRGMAGAQGICSGGSMGQSCPPNQSNASGQEGGQRGAQRGHTKRDLPCDSACGTFPPSNKPCVDYTVVSGDTMEIVAAKFGTQPFQIALDNSLVIPVNLIPGRVIAVRPGDGVETSRWTGSPSSPYRGPLSYSYPRPCAGVTDLEDQMKCFCSYHPDGFFQWPFQNSGCKLLIQCTMRVPQGGLQTCAKTTVVDDALRYGEAACSERVEGYACTDACSDHSCFCREYLLNEGNYVNPFDNDRASVLSCQFNNNTAWFKDLIICPLNTKVDYRTAQCVPARDAPPPFAVRKGVYLLDYYSTSVGPLPPPSPPPPADAPVCCSCSPPPSPPPPSPPSTPPLGPPAPAPPNPSGPIPAPRKSPPIKVNAPSPKPPRPPPPKLCPCLNRCSLAQREKAQKVGCKIPGCSQPCPSGPTTVDCRNPKCKCRLRGLCLEMYACSK